MSKSKSKTITTVVTNRKTLGQKFTKAYKEVWDLSPEQIQKELSAVNPNLPPLNDVVGATKHDSGKPQLSLNPVEALELMAQALAFGAQKYGKNNFKRGHAYSRTLDAALRHLSALAAGEFTDSDSGNQHLAHALASLAMLAHAMKHHPELDDLTMKEEVK